MVKNNHISPQYFRKDEVCVSILEIKSPAHFIVKESPDINTSSDAKRFVEAEDVMQKYYHSIEAEFFQIPLKDSIVVVLHKDKYYRAQVRSILTGAEGHIIKVYLLDYGQECNVSRQCLYEIHQDFLQYPFQAVEFKLFDIEPISLIVSSQDLSLNYGPVSTWDVSAITFIKDMQKVINSAHIKVKGVGESFLYGSLYFKFNNQDVKCINEELILKKFARQKENSSDVTDINTVLSTMELPHDNMRPGGEESNPISVGPNECSPKPTFSPKPESHTVVDCSLTPVVLSPSSNNKPKDAKNILQKLKMLKKKSSGGASNSTPVSPSMADIDAIKMPANDVSIDDTMQKLNIQENKVLEKTPNRAEISGKNQLLKLKKCRNTKKASPSPQKAPDASTPLYNQTSETSCTSPQAPLVQTSLGRFSGSVIEGISPITGNKSDVMSPSSCSLSLKEDTNSLNVAFMNSTKAKDAQKLSELSINEKESSNSVEENSIKASPPKPTSTKVHNLKNLYKKRNSLPFKPETKSNGNVETNLNPNEPALKPEIHVKDVEPMQESDSDASLSKIENGLNEGFSDLDDMGDLLHCVLNPKRNATIDSSPDSSRKSSLSSASSVDYQQMNDIDFSDKSLWEKQKVPALCIGEAVPTPLLSTGEASFPPALHKTLEHLNFRGPSCIQSVVWPSVERRRCLAAIGPPHSGKTVAYLLPIVSNFMSAVAYAELPKTTGPIVIILCSSWKKVQAVYDLIRTFLNGSKCKILTFFADGRSMKNKIAALLNGCDVLISVPYCLLDFFEGKVLCLKRCCHFILDDGSTLFSHNMKELKLIMREFVRGIELRTSVPVSLQVLICVERWSKSVASFVDKFMYLPLLLFTSFLEAAVYAKVPIHAHICDDKDKKQRLLGILEKTRKTIICTNSSNTASEVHSFLKCENVRSYLVTEEMEHYISDGVIQDWKSVRCTAAPHCLIVTDAAFTHMHISNANYLIHYDIPEISRLQFGNRFSCIAEHFTSLNGPPDCVCHILMSEDCAIKTPSLLKLIQRSGVAVCPELKDLVKKQTTMKKPADIPLCHYMKAFGSCSLPACPQRHHVDPDADKPNVTPCEGDVHVLVAHICDASHFYVRLLKYLLPDVPKPCSMSATYAKLGFQLKSFYSKECNQRKVEDPAVGLSYVLQDENSLFYRVKVLAIIPATEGQRKKLKLFFRDEGWVKISDNFQLLEYVEGEFPPPLAVEVYLCGVRTPDTCPNWNPQSSMFVSRLIKGKEIHGKIVLCLGETLWLHPVVIREKQIFTDEYLNVLSVDKSLIDAEYAIENKNHIPLLIKACRDIIPLPKEIKITPQDPIAEAMDQPHQLSYAFLELNIFEDVYVSNVVSPHEFHVQREKFVECLDRLSDQIQEKITSSSLEKCKALQNGMHCIALFQEDLRYYRAVITEVIADSDDAQVFFLDFGDHGRVSKDNTYVLPHEFTLLPFQAIKCELNGICAPHGGWTDKAGDTLYNLTRNEDGDMKILQMMAYKKSQQFGIGNHYIVDLWNSSDKTISEQLLEAGLVSSSEKFVPVDAPVEEMWDDNLDDLPDGYDASDEDLEEEDKIIQAKFLAEVAKMMYGLPPEAPTEAIVNEGTNYCVANGTTEDTPPKRKEKIVEVVEITPPIKRSPFQSMQKLLNCKKKEPKRAKPFITWWNTEQSVNILIHLRNIEVYELEVKDERFIFSTSLRGMEYHTEEEFYSSVHSDGAITNSTVEGLNISLKKQVSEQWPRLTKEKFSHIKYDLNHIDLSDSDETVNEERPINTSNPDESLVAHYESEDERSSDDGADDAYVQPWKKLAQYKDPFDPLD